MSYILSFVFMFMLVDYLVGNKLAGVVSGVIYAFSPYHLAHYAHPTLYNIQWLPLFVLSLFVLHRNRTVFFATVSALLFATVLYGDACYGFFAGIIALVFVIYKRLPLKTIVCFGLVSLIPILIFACCTYGVWGERMYFMQNHSAYWTDYVYPFGQGTTENVLYIGHGVLILAVLGMIKGDRFFLLLGIMALVLSLNNPCIPVFRASARWGVVVILSCSVLAGYGIKNLTENKWIKNILPY